MQNQCAEIKLRAERRGGELLKEQKRQPGETDRMIRSHGATISAAEPKLEELGINKSQSSRWQQIADVPCVCLTWQNDTIPVGSVYILRARGVPWGFGLSLEWGFGLVRWVRWRLGWVLRWLICAIKDR